MTNSFPMFRTLPPAAGASEAAAEEAGAALEAGAVLEEEPPHAVRAAEMVTAPEASRKLRREIFFIRVNLLQRFLMVWIPFSEIFSKLRNAQSLQEQR